MEISNSQNAPDPFFEKRKHPRVPCNAPIEYALKNRTYRNLSRDISTSGLFVETWNSASIGEAITLLIPLDNQEPIKIEGKVVRTDPQGIGVEFI